MIAVIVVYPFLWIWQGLDFTDTGFAITNANLALRAPAAIHYWGFNYWLTNIVGSIWLTLFGKLGLVGFRLASALLMIMTNWLVYRACKDFVRPFPLAVSILVGETLIERMYWLNYDNLSAFLFVWTGVLLIRGLVDRRLLFVFFSGLVFGVTLFARVTNVAGILLVIAVFVTALASRASLKTQIQQVCVFVVGMVLSATAVIGLMASLGQLHDFIENLNTLVSIAGGHANTHSSGKLVTEFLTDEGIALRTLAVGVVVFAWTVIVGLLLPRIRAKVVIPVLVLCSVIAAVGLSFPQIQDRYYFVAGMAGILYGILMASTILAIVQRDVRRTAASAVALLILFSLPIGSDLGIRLAVYGMYLALPISADLLTTRLPKLPVMRNRQGLRWSIKTLVLCVTLGVLIVGVVTGYLYTYRDTSQRMAMTSSLDNPKLRFIYTTAARAKVVNQLFHVLPRYVHPGDTLMAYEEVSLAYYVTDTIPYLDTPWPMLYEPSEFQAALTTAQQTHKSLPVVLRAKAATSHFDWPNDSVLRNDYRHHEDRYIMYEFLKKNHYTVAWQNSFFQILVPPGQ